SVAICCTVCNNTRIQVVPAPIKKTPTNETGRDGERPTQRRPAATSSRERVATDRPLLFHHQVPRIPATMPPIEIVAAMIPYICTELFKQSLTYTGKNAALVWKTSWPTNMIVNNPRRNVLFLK